MNAKQKRVKERYIKLETDVQNLFQSFMHESLTECRIILSEEVTRLVKAANLFSEYGGKYKTDIRIDRDSNLITVDVRTSDRWRVCWFKLYSDEHSEKLCLIKY